MNIKIFKKNKKALIALVSVAAAGAIAGTWAFFTQTTTMNNVFQTGDYKTTITEHFTPPTNWVPGVTVAKDVKVTNSGNVDVVVRASMTDLWTRYKDIVDANGTVISPKGTILNNTFIADNNTVQQAAEKVFGSAYAGTWDGTTPISSYAGKWLYIPTSNYFYYIGVVKPSTDTPSLITGVTMNPLLDATVSNTTTTVTTDSSGTTSTATTTTQGKYGYDSAQYTLGITAQTVQASSDAITSVFGNDAAATYLASIATISSTTSSTTNP